MASELERWAVTERQFLQNEIRWFNAGAKLTSPAGEDITAAKVKELGARLEHVRLALSE
ncbi:hypothetical protein J2800_000999 [Caulobacter rhizosphaerae]|uniref:Uncharacterized protein n=1 Tax=Caulobacter rhizosphaerae TaxID=2010972 RepID=A0ABU1MVZ3_9CAUL|nr:hypothetical protein [Caulobacter rhizosphaerae]MDR6530263.1 hypothetical protein [Caulobacter rhizosphaerae]